MLGDDGDRGARVPLTQDAVQAGRGATMWLDVVVLVGATIAAITCASLLPRLANR